MRGERGRDGKSPQEGPSKASVSTLQPVQPIETPVLVNGSKVVAMADGGAWVSVIDAELARQLGLSIESNVPLLCHSRAGEHGYGWRNRSRHRTLHQR